MRLPDMQRPTGVRRRRAALRWRFVMGLFDATTTAVSGLQAQAFAIQNISGNIANSQTIAFKEINTSFEDLVPDSVPSQQIAGGVIATSSPTNTVQGGIQAGTIGTDVA